MKDELEKVYCAKCFYEITHTHDSRCPECGHKFDRSNPSTILFQKEVRKKKYWRYWRVAKFGLILALALGLWYLVGHFRTQDFGSFVLTFKCFIISLVLGLPFGLLLWIGERFRIYAIGVILTISLPVIFVESLALTEEYLFLRQVRQKNSGIIFKDRVWPHQNNYIYYDPDTGEKGGGD